jgi:NAD(P)-dependent dehydrogenase (short-subunit alcohol dehydrogenase family)
MELRGKVIAVTGGFGALGRAVANAAINHGALVALVDRAAAPDPAELPPQLSAALLLGGVDLTDFEAAQRAVAAVADQYGGLDALINIAGTFRWQTLAEGDLSSWDFLYETNLKTAVVASKSALPHLRKRSGGRIINIGAAAATKAAAGMGAYASAKAGVAKLTESLAEELKDDDITVNAVLPSIIDTPANRRDMPAADFSRWVTPDAVADVIIFLASHAARAITGALLPVVASVQRDSGNATRRQTKNYGEQQR